MGWWDAGVWRETLVILTELLEEPISGPNRVARWLAPASPQVALGVLLRSKNSTLANVEVTTRTALIAGARSLTNERNPYGRASAYRILGIFDADARRGVGLRADGLPDIFWCEVPAGEFVVGPYYAYDNPRQIVTLPKFLIAKYPITYKQFQSFIDAPDGYMNRVWWDGFHADGLVQQQGGPGKQSFKFWNHPRENVSWYDAVAFCRWLSVKLRQGVRLPTEDEWYAACGIYEREYPYLSGFDPTETDDLNINQTCAVGIFPNSVSLYGLMDTNKNVSEWTLTESDNSNINDFSNNSARALSRGSWYERDIQTRFRFADFVNPTVRSNMFGFRVTMDVQPSI